MNTELNDKGIKAATRFLERRGYDIVETNWECESGSVDIIAREESALVFCEVVTRTATEEGFPEETNGASKRKKYENIALSYLTEHTEDEDITVRFDVLTIVVLGESRALLRHHINAFSTDAA